MLRGLSAAGVMLALFCASMSAARALDFSVEGYGDIRLVAAPRQTSWLYGGLSKFRYGGDDVLHVAEGVVQGTAKLDDNFSLIGVVRAEPVDRVVVDPLEAYLSWHKAADENGISWSAKAGAFFPTISLENDDLGWASPYTLTPSAINTWIGEELRTIGGEGTLRWNSPGYGTFSVIGALLCCNDPAGILLADRGWVMDDRPTGLFERLRLPDASIRAFRQVPPQRTGEFDEIDGSMGWYAGLTWTMSGIGKLTVLRYDNDADPAVRTARDTSWDTRFWSAGFRTQYGPLVLIAQAMRGQTVVVPRPGLISDTKFQSAFLLASYDLDEEWRVSVRGDAFATRHVTPTPPHAMSEDGSAVTAALIYSPTDWLRLTGEVLAMRSRRLEYVSAGMPSSLPQNQFQFSTRVFF